MLKGRHRIFWKAVYFTAAVSLLGAATTFGASPAAPGPPAEAIDVVQAYLKATHARDPKSAYRLISTADQRIRDKETYLKSAEALEGFALALARKLAAGLKVRIIEQQTGSSRARIEVAYEVPTGDELAARLLDWDAGKLNALPLPAQRRLAEALDELQQRSMMITLQGRETFRLVREAAGWKIFLDWASRTRVIFKSVIPRSGELAVRFVHNDFLVRMNDPFHIHFMLENRGTQPIVARLNHVIEPRGLADHVEMISCGSLAPVSLAPGVARKLTSSYILAGLGAKSRVAIVYQFTVSPQKAANCLSSRKHPCAS